MNFRSRDVFDWLTIILSALAALSVIAGFVYSQLRIMPSLTEKLEVLVMQVGSSGDEQILLPVTGPDSQDEKAIYISIPFEIIVTNIGKPDSFLRVRESPIEVKVEENLPSDCAYQFVGPSPLSPSLTGAELVKSSLHVAPGDTAILFTWLTVKILGEPARILLERDPPIASEGSKSLYLPEDLARELMHTSLALCKAGMEVKATVTTTQKNPFSSDVVQWNPPFVSSTLPE